MSDDRVRIRFLFAEEGGYHSEVLSLPGGGRSGHLRLIDFLLEDEAVAAECFIDIDRLCSAQIVEDE